MELNKVIIEAGLPAVFDEGKTVLLSLFPETVEAAQTQPSADGEPALTVEATTQTAAFQVRVTKPLTRSRAINAAEQEAYGLRTAMEVASFNASLARKARLAETANEVAEHDQFISDVKAELTRIGVK